MTFTVDDAIRIARAAHEGQVDKSGKPYIGHPLRVMSTVSGEHARMAAVLHDVLEDTDLTADDLRAAGCPPEVVDTVVALSHLPGEPREDYLERALTDPVAVVVKRADIADNMSPPRLALLDQATQERLRKKYAHSLDVLGRGAR
ncbi:HD domain-containing protein [Saccharothrix yanglingensis]|uniref:Phosphohydrolase n=1 Tax=Saccharothrix yanglingensis TaxID=659496 RepID=A0ABU0X1D3_9PSEU|nr:HD domain-containing protein [Saccharothrix yanglingensis]MDQ2585941.1 phosphohydrolase [Saccharothrix yanglingensis]